MNAVSLSLAALLAVVGQALQPDAKAKEFLETKSKAEAGDADAQYALAGLYAKGVGVTKNEAESVKLYRALAERNDPRGQSMLGVMLTNGRGVTADFAEAIKWFRKAAEQNSTHAQYNLGYMYAVGKGVPRDDAESTRYYRLAAEQGDVASQRALASRYATGKGVPLDLVQALAWTKVIGDPAAKRQMLVFEKQMTPTQIAEASRVAQIIAARLAKLKQN